MQAPTRRVLALFVLFAPWALGGCSALLPVTQTVWKDHSPTKTVEDRPRRIVGRPSVCPHQVLHLDIAYDDGTVLKASLRVPPWEDADLLAAPCARCRGSVPLWWLGRPGPRRQASGQRIDLGQWMLAFDPGDSSITLFDRRSGRAMREFPLEARRHERSNWEGTVVRSLVTPPAVALDVSLLGAGIGTAPVTLPFALLLAWSGWGMKYYR